MKKILTLAAVLTALVACSPMAPHAGGKDNRTKVVILGDSYSTFEGHIPQGYACWYFPGPQGNDVHEVKQCWWHILTRKMNYNLLYNSSFSGSAVCYTGYGNMTPQTSFIERAKVDIAAEDGSIGRCGQKPDLIYIFGGTNDVWSNSPMGQPLPADSWKSAKREEYFPAVCYLFGYLKEKLPDTELVFILNTELNGPISRTMPEICKDYGVKCIVLEQIDKISSHPSVAGMRKIADQVAAAMK